MIRRLQPWFVNTKKRLVKSPKMYVRDTGILHSLLNISTMDDLLSNPGWIEWEMIEADDDWTGTRVGVRLTQNGEHTMLDFYHSGWRHANDHFRTTSCCWAAYLRVLRRFLEHGERVPYDVRLDV